ncbi:isochorismatase family protein [Bacillus sp. FJAT-27245]|uniref:isochorismatase family protein n=1 Tax=Bacillus sp. FJAT-27245 TaxID=1684144 RepID=UPI000A3DDFBA|nr:isochorismatase family protein [Bacillus sp. FJAT-27245]
MGNTALLVIDAQVGMIEGPKFGPVFEKEALLDTMKKVVDKARSESVPIIFMMDTEIASPISIESQVHPHISPTRDDITITKKAADAFHLTTLHDYLQTLDIRHLVIMGCKTEYGVDTTCRSATTLGYDVTLVEDGHSTTANKVLGAKEIIAHHNCTLHGLDNIENFILVRNSDEDIFNHRHADFKN